MKHLAKKNDIGSYPRTCNFRGSGADKNDWLWTNFRCPELRFRFSAPHAWLDSWGRTALEPRRRQGRLPYHGGSD